MHKNLILYLILGVTLSVLLMVIFPKWTVDDAYISYRYGKNLVEHGELNWNPGEDPVEGYTGVALPLLAAASFISDMDPVITIRILSVLFFLIGYVFFYKCLELLGLSEFNRILFGLIYIIAPIHYIHLFSGLETIIYIQVFPLGSYVFLKLMRENNQAMQYGFPVMAFIFGLIRPEGFLWGGLLLLGYGLYLILNRKTTEEILKFIAQTSVLFVFPFVILLFWRVDYYDSLLPNSYYVKHYDGGLNLLSIKDLFKFFLNYSILPIACLSFLIIALPGNIRIYFEKIFVKSELKKGLPIFLGIILLFISILVFQYIRSWLFMGFGHRFYYPIFILSLLFIAPFFPCPDKWDRNRIQAYLIIGGMLITQAILHGAGFYQQWNYVTEYQSIMEAEWKPVAKWIKENIPENSTLIAYQDAGYIPYETGLKTIDFGRLNNEYLAREQPDIPAATDYFFSQDADVVVMTSFSSKKLNYYDEAEAIVADSRFSVYRLVKVFSAAPEVNYHQMIFIKQPQLPNQGQ